MIINSIISNHYRYATTNPPINENRRVTLSVNPMGIELAVETNYNGAEGVQKYHVTPDQFKEVISLFEELNISEHIAEELKKEKSAPPAPMQVGGYSNTPFAYTADGETVTLNKSTEKTDKIIAKISEISNNCGEPFYESGTGLRINNIGMVMVPPQVPVASEKEENDEPFDGEWKCNACGYAHNTGKFCSECGMPKQ